MPKGKDPAFLFYPADFIMGTYSMSDSQVGKYIRLLCIQHSKGGRLTLDEMVKVCGVLDKEIMEKFEKSDDGYYYNSRLNAEVDKRKKHAEKQRDNINKRWNKGKESDKKEYRTDTKVIPELYQNDTKTIPLEDEDENRNENRIKDVIKDKEEYLTARKDIIDFLNKCLGTKYRHTTQKTKDLIVARLNEGFTVEDFKTVISKKSKEWLNDKKMSSYLRPETLFSNKFEGYLNQIAKSKNQTDQFLNDGKGVFDA